MLLKSKNTDKYEIGMFLVVHDGAEEISVIIHFWNKVTSFENEYTYPASEYAEALAKYKALQEECEKSTLKSYKEFDKTPIGVSDIASLIIRSSGQLRRLDFGEDGAYNAYIVTEEAYIGEHYRLVFEGTGWIKIYDDTTLSFSAQADTIRIYRSGAFGCIIQLIKN